ncbi:hypothetical protein G7Y89_g2569 [Cudoniella acicularis]|uniref:tyrosinase n=1 Tax=Cudoniella acicularis TaxID=354080 RepID=A0A8H4W988_9HELO|nr:hypothetical protein G7Y89_g2569 [Cudoniella acicularis]
MRRSHRQSEVGNYSERHSRSRPKFYRQTYQNLQGIQDKPVTDPNSFFYIAGLHGQPFRGAGYANRDWWGGYCHHGNVLFPTWHRAYLLHLEEALRKISGCENIALPYWNQMKGTIPMRYPYSGLVGPDDRKRTETHNNNIRALGEERVNGMLNARVNKWLDRHPSGSTGMRERYRQSLLAPNYTVFSNTTSAAKHNDGHFSRSGEPDHDPSAKYVVSLKSSHNGMHLAVGGYDMGDGPDPEGPGANGDMGENDTAGFDPIFYFHHCFIDRVFWSWQTHNNAGDELEIIEGYPGTSSGDSQGPMPGTSADSWLTMKTLLHPFKKAGSNDPPTSIDMINITKLKYKYDSVIPKPINTESYAQATPILRVSGIDRSHIADSFVVSIWADTPKSDTLKSNKGWLVGFEPVFSRWHVSGCANCQNSLTVTAHVPVISPPSSFAPFPQPLPYEKAKLLKYEVRLLTNVTKEAYKMVHGSHQELGEMLLEL